MEKANFYEGMTEMARHIATVSETASLSVVPSVDGVTQVSASVIPSSDRRAEAHLPELPA